MTNAPEAYTRDHLTYNDDWQSQSGVYSEAWRYYRGTILDKLADNSDSLLYPLRLNIIKHICRKHALFLWGQYEKARIVRFVVHPPRLLPDEAKKKHATELSRLYWDFLRTNQGVTLLRELGRIYMVLGGAVLKTRYTTSAKLGVALETISPEYFYPVWDPANYSRLLRAHVCYPLHIDQASLLYGYTKASGDPGMSVNYLETWDEQSWAVWVGYEGRWQAARDRLTGQELAGPNLLRDPLTTLPRLPFTYIPRMRTGSFYGDSLVLDLRGLQNELNARLADAGDAMTQASHPGGWAHDIRKRGRGPIQITSAEILDLGDTPPGGQSPYVEQFPPPDLTTGSSDLTNKLEKLLYDLASVSPVMNGEDEGSQRSSATLAMRALPTLTQTDDYRANWSEGLLDAMHAFLCICLAYGGLNGVTEADFAYETEIAYAPVLPRDRMETADEIAKLRPAGAMSQERSIRLQSDVEDVEAELALVQAEEQQKFDRQQAVKAASQPAPGSKPAGNASGGKAAGAAAKE